MKRHTPLRQGPWNRHITKAQRLARAQADKQRNDALRDSLSRYQPHFGRCPITGGPASQIHHVMHHRGHSTHDNPLIHTHLNCWYVSQEGHERAHGELAVEAALVGHLVMAYGWPVIKAYYEGASVRGTGGTFEQYLHRLGVLDSTVRLMMLAPSSEEDYAELRRLGIKIGGDT